MLQSNCLWNTVITKHTIILFIREEIEPIGDGPRFNPDGKADVSTSLTGSYSITTDDLKRALPNKIVQ